MSVITYSFPVNLPFKTSKPHVSKIVMLQNNQAPCKKSPEIQISGFSNNNKVFEDKALGVICYRDDNGEIVCEGYDEGPRFISPTLFHHRDAEILDLLQERWIQIVNSGGFKNPKNGVSNFKGNGFNKFL
ncbi:hypothetical protein ES319_A09G079100v1 [Gossypium barbadense]|uniref:Uncharacterized protein n=3 Tax=Gossypium TaxID=3633 RepID=A0A2P5Y2H5_GOSBA|nr:hypothetical protein ES319_A09G079100v1 [Gossypium barbadense]PPS09804.1 hypothetical protein GOBAR_AA10856 [Gossypium barbadense]TYH01907.1 hypothetical protein ES288_A09G097700v1 [Gossypium darwinii]TYI09718.1 hypothetical protein ES332_A09G093000v1 [Gossypium tomentosum]